MPLGNRPDFQARWKNTVQQMLTDRCEIWVKTKAQTGAADYVQTYVAKYVNVPCYFATKLFRQQNVEEYAGREILPEVFKIYFGVDNYPHADDRVYHGGFMYEIRGVSDDTTQNRYRLISVTRVD